MAINPENAIPIEQEPTITTPPDILSIAQDDETYDFFPQLLEKETPQSILSDLEDRETKYNELKKEAEGHKPYYKLATHYPYQTLDSLAVLGKCLLSVTLRSNNLKMLKHQIEAVVETLTEKDPSLYILNIEGLDPFASVLNSTKSGNSNFYSVKLTVWHNEAKKLASIAKTLPQEAKLKLSRHVEFEHPDTQKAHSVITCETKTHLKPFNYGIIGGHSVSGPVTDEDGSPQEYVEEGPIPNPQILNKLMLILSREREFLNMSYQKGQATVVEVLFSDNPVKSIKLIDSQAALHGGRVIHTDLNRVLVIFRHEKHSAASVEFAKSILENNQIAAKCLVTDAPCEVHHFFDKPILLGEIHHTIKNLESILGHHPKVKLLSDESVAERIQTDPRLKTEVQIEVNPNPIAKGVKSIENITRSEKLFMPDPFVGREKEMRHIEEFLNNPFTHSNEELDVFAITGSAGMGKSKLLYECLKAHKDAIYCTSTPTHRFNQGWFIKELFYKISLLSPFKGQNHKFSEFPFFSEYLAGNEVPEEKLLNELIYALNTLSELDQSKKNPVILMLDNLETCDGFSARILRKIFLQKQSEVKNIKVMLAGRPEVPQSFLDWFQNKPNRIFLKELDLFESDHKTPNQNCYKLAFGLLNLDLAPQFHAQPTESVIKEILCRSGQIPLSIVEETKKMKHNGEVKIKDGIWYLNQEISETTSLSRERNVIEIVQNKINDILLHGSPELQRAFAIWLALGSANPKIMAKIADNRFEGAQFTHATTDLRQSTVAVLKESLDGGTEFIHPLFQEEGLKMIESVDHTLMAIIYESLAKTFDIWRSEEAQTDAQRELPDPLSIYRLAKQATAQNGGDQKDALELRKKYLLPAVSLLKSAYANTELEEEAIYGYNHLSRDLSLVLDAAIARTRLNKYDESDNLLNILVTHCLRKLNNPELEINPDFLRFCRQVFQAWVHNAHVSRNNPKLLERINIWQESISHQAAESNEEIRAQREQILSYMGKYHFNKNDYDSGLETFETIANFAQNPDLKWEAMRMIGKSNANTILFSGQKTPPYIDKPDVDGLIILIQNNPTILEQLNLPLRQLEDYVKKVREGEITIQEQESLVAAMEQIVHIYAHLGNHQKAIESAQDALQAAKMIEKPEVIGRSQSLLGVMHSLDHDFETAAKASQDGLAESFKAKAWVNYPAGYINHTQILIEKGEFEPAIDFWERTAQIIFLCYLRKNAKIFNLTPPNYDLDESRVLELFLQLKDTDHFIKSFPDNLFTYQVLPTGGKLLSLIQNNPQLLSKFEIPAWFCELKNENGHAANQKIAIPNFRAYFSQQFGKISAPTKTEKKRPSQISPHNPILVQSAEKKIRAHIKEMTTTRDRLLQEGSNGEFSPDERPTIINAINLYLEREQENLRYVTLLKDYISNL